MSNLPLSRRRLLTATGAGLLAAGLPGQARAASAEGRPNILWLVSEDNNPYLGAYGDPLARTPTIDRLAGEGVLYRNAFSTAPVCAPSRFAIITGMSPETCGPAEHMRASGNVPSFLRGFPQYLRESGYYCSNNAKTDYNATFDPAALWNESSRQAHWRKRTPGTPFFSVFNSELTHESSLWLVPATGHTDPAAVPVPAYLPDTANIRTDRAHYYDNLERMDAWVAARLAELDADGLAEDTIVFYYSDNGGVLPRSKRYTYDSGLHTALIMKFPPKWAHLAPAPAGSVVDAPTTSLDLAPTVLTLAGLAVPAHLEGVSLTSARRPPYAFGMRNRMDERYDMVRTVRDERYRYIRNYRPHRPWGQHNAFEWQQKGYQDWEQAHLDGTLNAIQDRFWGEKPAEELYDLRTDPDEVHDLAADPHHRGHLQRLSRALDEHMLELNDNGFIPEGSPLEGYDASRVPGAYPLRRIMRLAARAIERDPRNLHRFVTALADENEVIRYWAAAGIVMLQGHDCAPAATALEAVLADDPSPHVRIEAAEALVRLGRTGQAVPYLAETLDTHPDLRVRLQAVTALTYVGAAALPALPVIERAAAVPFSNLPEPWDLRVAANYLRLVLTGAYTPTADVINKGGTT